MFDLTFNNFTTDKKYDALFFKKAIRKALNKLGFRGKSIELSVNLVGENRIRALNKKYRGKNKITDVLSFPLQDKIDAKSVQSGIISLGDVFICLPTAKKRALKEGRSLSSRLVLLAVHGLLHLLGYDHEKSEGEKEKMFELQERILERLATGS